MSDQHAGIDDLHAPKCVTSHGDQSSDGRAPWSLKRELKRNTWLQPREPLILIPSKRGLLEIVPRSAHENFTSSSPSQSSSHGISAWSIEEVPRFTGSPQRWPSLMQCRQRLNRRVQANQISIHREMTQLCYHS